MYYRCSFPLRPLFHPLILFPNDRSLINKNRLIDWDSWKRGVRRISTEIESTLFFPEFLGTGQSTISLIFSFEFPHKVILVSHSFSTNILQNFKLYSNFISLYSKFSRACAMTYEKKKMISFFKSTRGFSVLFISYFDTFDDFCWNVFFSQEYHPSRKSQIENFVNFHRNTELSKFQLHILKCLENISINFFGSVFF